MSACGGGSPSRGRPLLVGGAGGSAGKRPDRWLDDVPWLAVLGASARVSRGWDSRLSTVFDCEHVVESRIAIGAGLVMLPVGDDVVCKKGAFRVHATGPTVSYMR